MANKNAELRYHANNYVKAVFAERLRSEGFYNLDDQYLCWYRLVSDDLIHTISFITRYGGSVIMLEVGYGMHPLFMKPFYTKNVRLNDDPCDHGRLSFSNLEENCPINAMMYMPYAPDAWVSAPGRDGRGIYTYDGIIGPQMQQVQTIEAAYEWLKQKYIYFCRGDMKNAFQSPCPTFIDEAIYLDDREMYPFCKREAMKCINQCKNSIARFPNKRIFKDDLAYYEQLKKVFFEDGREEYLQILEQRRKKNLADARKKMGILTTP